MNRLNMQQNCNQKNSIRLILLFSVVFNLLSFLLVIAIYPPVWYTNDDYRMMTIVSGAYTGTPSADIVFMRYPIGLMLSGLYSLTTQIPWYGIFTMICMFVPSCIFCYYIVKKAYLKNYTLLGVCIYVLAFLFLIRKYICIPQFTLTSAFMGAGAIALLYEMPAHKNKGHIIFASICAALSFAIRSKAFYLLLPIMALIIIVRLVNEKGTRIWKPFVSVCLATLVLCSGVFAVDYLAWNRSEEYQEFKSFNIARSNVYDYGSVPSYYDNMPFYVENGISEVTYRAIASRYLDLDDSVDTETLETVGNYIQQISTESGSLFERIKSAFEETVEYWLDCSDETVKYSVLFVFILLAVVLIFSAKKKKLNIIFPATVAGIVLESVYLEFSGRLIVRVVDMLLLAAGILGCLIAVDMLRVREKSLREYCSALLSKKKKLISMALIVLSVVTVVFAGVICLNTALENKYQSVTVTYNSRLDTLKDYAKLHPESFFFYDSNDFIACTGYVFETYDEGEVLNHDSLGSWNCTSPTYYQRNAQFGFTSSADGLTSDDCEVYFVTANSVRTGMTKTLKDKYNKKLSLVDSVESETYILHIYMVVDDD
ncbi:MAG: hypothetical protein ACI4XI_08390 [Ruminococcus sp.]